MKQYRLSIDDNIWVFRDLAAASPQSIFENDYLAFLLRLHNKFGTKIQLNVYYETNGFKLSEMPDRWRGQWCENSNWLRLSFHSRADMPPSPYADSGYDEVFRDCTAVQGEILRFAGEEALSPFTTIHYTDTSGEGCRALKDCGIRGLAGLFGTREAPMQAYSLPREVCDLVRENGSFFESVTGLWYFCNDMVINNIQQKDLGGFLEKTSHKFLEIMIHEQCFYEDYSGFLADFEERVETVLRWLSENSYSPAFLEEPAVQI